MLIKKIIVIGGSGFLGTQILKVIQKSNKYEATCGDIILNNSLKYNYEKIDIMDKDDLQKKLDKYDIIINCTGQITHPFNICYNLNTVGVDNLAKTIIDTRKRLVHISTVAVYGSAYKCDEESPLNPETNYATAKAFAEQTLLRVCDEKQVVVLRLSNLYGSSQKKGVFAYLIRSYFSDRKLNFNNNGDLFRFFLHVEDCSEMIFKIIKNEETNGIYNLKGHQGYNIKSLIEEFENRFVMVFEKTFGQELPWENIQEIDNSKLSSTINHEPAWNLLDFIEKEIKGMEDVQIKY